MEIFIFIAIWAALAWGVAKLAITRGRNPIGFLLLSFFFSPILGLIVLLIMSNLVDARQELAQAANDEVNREQRQRDEHERQLESIKTLAANQKSDQSSQPSAASPTSVADEIRKLGALRTEGLLTEAEFQSQKSALLSPLSHT